MVLTTIAEIAFGRSLWRSRNECPNEIIDEGDHDDKEEDNLSLGRKERGEMWDNINAREPECPAILCLILLQAMPIFRQSRHLFFAFTCRMSKANMYTKNSYYTI